MYFICVALGLHKFPHQTKHFCCCSVFRLHDKGVTVPPNSQTMENECQSAICWYHNPLTGCMNWPSKLPGNAFTSWPSSPTPVTFSVEQRVLHTNVDLLQQYCNQRSRMVVCVYFSVSVCLFSQVCSRTSDAQGVRCLFMFWSALMVSHCWLAACDAYQSSTIQLLVWTPGRKKVWTRPYIHSCRVIWSDSSAHESLRGPPERGYHLIFTRALLFEHSAGLLLLNLRMLPLHCGFKVTFNIHSISRYSVHQTRCHFNQPTQLQIYHTDEGRKNRRGCDNVWAHGNNISL